MNHRLETERLLDIVNAFLVEFPELRDDEELRLGTLEGETSLMEVASAIVAREGDIAAMMDAIADRIGVLRARSDRLERQRGGLRQLLARILEAADIRKLELPEATVSARQSKPKPEVYDADALPPECQRLTIAPSMTAIRKYIETTGMTPPGVALKNGEPVLTIRRG